MEPVTSNDELGRRHYQRDYTRVRRANETEDQRRQRLARLSKRQQERLANESPEQRQRRLEGLCMDRKRRMQREPSEEREQRRERNRIKQQIFRQKRALRGRGFMPRQGGFVPRQGGLMPRQATLVVLYSVPDRIYEQSGRVARQETLGTEARQSPGAVPTTSPPLEIASRSAMELKLEHTTTSDEEPLWKLHDSDANSSTNNSVHVKPETDPSEPSDVHDYDICIPDIKLECALSVHVCGHECTSKDCNFCFLKVHQQNTQS